MRTFYYLLFFGLFLFLNQLPAEVYSAQNIRKKDLAEKLPIQKTNRTADTIFVVPPTGEREMDRASIIAAIEEIKPGGTIQFAPGMYVVGKVIQIKTPNITLLGHPNGTVLRGCEPNEFTEIEDALASVTSPAEGWAVVSGCGMLELTGGFVTIRNFIFEYSRLGLILGSSHAEDILYPADGGYLIEDNIFRNSSNSIRALLASPEPTIIRNNRFINVFHALSAGASNIHMLNNHISVPEPEKIPLTAHPGFAIGIHELGAGDSVTTDKKMCDQNIIQGNWIEGHPDGITINSYFGKDGCQKNVIEENTIIVQRVPFFASWPYFDDYPLSNKQDSTFVGIPVALYHSTETVGNNNFLAETKDNLIRGNHIVGGLGLGIEILNASQNRITNNTITKITRREPFPGNTLGGTQFDGKANGSGIWVSSGSNRNEITGNTFEDVASAAVFLEGNNNRVELRKAGDSVRDLGTGNQTEEIISPTDTTVAFTNVTIIDVEKGVHQTAMTIIVIGERITAVGPEATTEVPADATVIDATGKFMIPGLWDMHVHTGSDKDTREIIYPLFITHGVTGIRNMHGDCVACGKEFSIEQLEARRNAIASGDLVGPRVVASSMFAGSHEQAANGPNEGSSPQAPATEEDAREFVRLAKERGVDFIKVYDMLPREAYFALADEAKRLGLPFAGHVPIAVRASEASDAGQRSIEHLGMGNVLEECSSREKEFRRQVIAELYKSKLGSRISSDGPALLPLLLEMVETYDPEKCLKLAERFVRNETWIVPTLMVNRLPGELEKDWREDPFARFLSAEERQLFEELEEIYVTDLGNAEQLAPISQWIREVLKAMNEAGVRIMAGTDAGDTGVFWGISLHQELELLVNAGLSEAEALRAATLRPAEFFKITDNYGSIEKGKIADMVLLNANPLEDISNTRKVHAVVLNGRYFNRQALDEMLIKAEQAANSTGR